MQIVLSTNAGATRSYLKNNIKTKRDRSKLFYHSYRYFWDIVTLDNAEDGMRFVYRMSALQCFVRCKCLIITTIHLFINCIDFLNNPAILHIQVQIVQTQVLPEVILHVLQEEPKNQKRSYCYFCDMVFT